MYNQNHPWIKYKELKLQYKKQLNSLSNESLNKEFQDKFDLDASNVSRKEKRDKFLEKFDEMFYTEFEKAHGYSIEVTKNPTEWKKILESKNDKKSSDSQS